MKSPRNSRTSPTPALSPANALAAISMRALFLRYPSGSADIQPSGAAFSTAQKTHIYTNYISPSQTAALFVEIICDVLEDLGIMVERLK